ncbi:MAG: Alkylhydroperoxidase family enzyme, contains CxxC motif [Chloroflexi bacterium]|nr:MAG: Alkylhydroperoxidase family enzyme, contains CxxC motif [Chloroflexota bacterium]
MLRKLCNDDALVEALLSDYTQASLSSEDRALLDYIAKLTLTPAQMTEADMWGLRNHGFTDEEIIHAINVCTVYNMNDRIADACGLTAKDL